MCWAGHESVGCILPRSLRWVVPEVAACARDTRTLCQDQRLSAEGQLQLIRRCNRLHGCEIKFSNWKDFFVVPSHIALSCSGVFVVDGMGAAEAGLLSINEGFSSSPTLLGIRAVPSVMAEKFMPINRSIMSWVAFSWSYPAIWDALKIYDEWAI